MAIIMPLFQQAARVEAGEAVSDAEIEAVFTRWVKPVPAAVPR